MTEEQIIDIAVKKSTENIFETLRKNGFEIREKNSTFQKTEQLLYLMPQLSDAINHNKKKIEELQTYGIPKNSGAIKTINNTTPVRQDEEELIDNEVNRLLQRNHIINSQIKWINSILQTIKSDKFYEILELKYYKHKTYEEMAEYLHYDVSTVGRNKSRLINHIKILLFPNDSMSELGC